jgi:hypothetical protein
LSDFLISSTKIHLQDSTRAISDSGSSAKIHLQDSTRAISDSGLNVVGRFYMLGLDNRDAVVRLLRLSLPDHDGRQRFLLEG